MDYFHAFFPYRDFLSEPKLAVTPWFITAIVVYFSLSALWLLARLQILQRKLRRYSTTEDWDSLREDRSLSNIWRGYQQTFVSTSGEWRLTLTNARDIFREQEVIGSYVSLRYFTSIPGILLGIGIFGTFLGLTLGIEGFDTSDESAITTSIDTLLAGMGTAFLSSLYGMATSILFGVWEKWLFSRLAWDLNQFNTLLDSKFHLSRSKEMRLQEHKQEQVIKKVVEEAVQKYFVSTADGVQVNPSHMLRDLVRNADEQTLALKSFSTDLADGIMISTATIERLGDRLGVAVSRNMTEAIMPAIDSLSSAVDELRSEKEESAGEFLKEVADNLQQTVQQMLTDIHESLSGTAIKQMEDLAAVVADAGASLKEVPDAVENTMAGFDAGAARLRESVLEASEAIHRQSAELLSGFANTLERTERLAQILDETLSELGVAATKINEASSGIGIYVDAIRNHGDELARNTESFRQEWNEFMEAQNESTDVLTSAFKSSAESLESYGTQIRNVSLDVENVFEAVRNGLTGYEAQIAESVNALLSEFTNSVSQAVRMLGGGIEDLQEGVEQLSDIVDQISKKDEQVG